MRSKNLGKIVDRTHHVSRKFIAIIPLLLICGIIAQMVLLIMAVILYVPALVFPALLNGIYRTITKAMAHLFAQSLFGRKSHSPRADPPGEVPPAGRVSRDTMALGQDHQEAQ
jgi:hypothetical protein